MLGIGPMELIPIIILLALILWKGPQGIPKIAKALGRSSGEFRTGIEEASSEMKKSFKSSKPKSKKKK